MGFIVTLQSGFAVMSHSSHFSSVASVFPHAVAFTVWLRCSGLNGFLLERDKRVISEEKLHSLQELR